MYFINEDHQGNYDLLCRKYPLSYSDTQYQVACYITAIPMIFEKVSRSKYIDEDNPCSWFYEFEENPNDVDFDLSSSMVELGRIMLNLWNGDDRANLSDCIGVLDQESFIALITAIHIRKGFYKGV